MQTAADLQVTISDTNSGVYQYNTTFGASSDESNTYPIYYYRGILDGNLDGTSSTYGSNGDGVTWPNYVRLGDTCWRIVRTTGSGGIKMIYNGPYSGGSTANSCANTTTYSRIGTGTYGKKGNSGQSSNWIKNINRVGYTYNNSSSVQDKTTSTNVDTIFGTDSTFSTINTEKSNVKNIIETWFSNNLLAYEQMLEPNAGYCNERSAYSNQATSTALTSMPLYSTSTSAMYFGPYGRNQNTNKIPSLTCPSTRGVVDLYTTASAAVGNHQLSYPIALLTVDEASFAGSGSTTAANGSTYHVNSFLSAGGGYWTMSPYGRGTNGNAWMFTVASTGRLGYDNVGVTTYGIRPVVSLKPGVSPESGSGTAVDPWVFTAP